jgi:deoxyribonuclease V
MKWPKNIGEARKIQHEIKERVKIIPLKRNPGYIAGVDAAFSGKQVIGTACIFTFPELILQEESYAVTNILFPYIPGYLSFREGPAVIKALKHLKIRPDIILFDGQGIAHPKRAGIASHIGVLLNIPSIGCAKSKLVGEYEDPGDRKGSYSPLVYRGEKVGAVLRTRDYVKPVFVSPGHKINLKKAIEVVLRCAGSYRIPEPLRCADSLSKKLKQDLM